MGTANPGLVIILKRLLDVKTDTSAELIAELHDFFLSSLRIVPDVASYKSSQEKVYRHLLSGLSDVIDNLEFEPFKLRVTGTAGSGKTQVTLAFCDRMLAQEKKPLLLCYNRALADKLKEVVGTGVMVNTYPRILQGKGCGSRCPNRFFKHQ